MGPRTAWRIRERFKRLAALARLPSSTAALTPRPLSEALKAQVAEDSIPNAHLKVLEGVGHLSPLEAPAELAAAIGEFLAKVA